jgi:hypothetical protein
MDFTGFDLQVHAFENGLAVYADVEIFDLQHVLNVPFDNHCGAGLFTPPHLPD